MSIKRGGVSGWVGGWVGGWGLPLRAEERLPPRPRQTTGEQWVRRVGGWEKKEEEEEEEDLLVLWLLS